MIRAKRTPELELTMRMLGPWLTRKIACVAVLSLVPFLVLAAAGQDTSATQSAKPISSAQNQSNNAGGGATNTNAVPPDPATLPNSPGSVRSQTIAENLSPDAQQSSSKPQTQEPVGTAAAESVESTGVAASNPAGAAIAPAKQRRTRAILIKVGALVGAGVAIGTVAALSAGSPSRPPGAR
jgi:hypothetical protein